jgi:hypothetical protein
MICLQNWYDPARYKIVQRPSYGQEQLLKVGLRGNHPHASEHLYHKLNYTVYLIVSFGQSFARID